MDAFLTRKKRKLSPDEDTVTPPVQTTVSSNDDEPTDVKLALLISLHPGIDQETLLDVLLAHDGSVSQAETSLRGSVGPKKGSGVLGAQSSSNNEMCCFQSCGTDLSNSQDQ